MNTDKTAIFLIESGKPLEMVKQYIADKERVRLDNNLMCKELGVSEYRIDSFNGVITAVKFESNTHPDFTKPNKKHGVSSPKKGTEFQKRFAAEKGHAVASELISEEFNIPLHVSFSDDHGISAGWTRIGRPFNECGFLYCSKNGPFGMWCPDVEEIVKEQKCRNIDEPAKSFKLNIEGAKRISKDEWDLIALQFKVDQKKREEATA